MLASQIAMGVFHRRLNSLITNLYLVMVLIALSQTLQNSNAVSHIWLFYADLGKTPGKGRIFFNMFLVLFLRRSANCPQSSAS